MVEDKIGFLMAFEGSESDLKTIQGELDKSGFFPDPLIDSFRDWGNYWEGATHIVTYTDGEYSYHTHSGECGRVFTLPQDLYKALEAIKERVK